MEIDIAGWVKQSRLNGGLTQEQLGEKLSMTKGNVSSLENGRTVPSYALMLKICKICDVSLPSQESKSPTNETAVIINELSIDKEYLNNDFSDYFALDGDLSFSRKWLKQMDIDASECNVIYIKGLSMYPTLQDNQAALIDKSQTSLIENKVFLIARDSTTLLIKRVLRDKEGSWIYVSDNADKNRYANMFAYPNDKIIGRIVWTGGNAGL